MERFQYYGELEKVVQGTGKLYLKNGEKHNISFEIAKRKEENLLFEIIIDHTGIFAFSNFDRLDRIEGKDDKGRKVVVTGLIAKSSTIGSKVISNGYARKCEIGKKSLKKDYQINFNLTNFLFDGNRSKIIETEKGKKYTKSILQLSFPDISFTIDRDENYLVRKKLLKRQGGILNTSILKVSIGSKSKLDKLLTNVRKLCQLLSVARSTYINWTSYKIHNEEGQSIYELYGNRLTRNYSGNNIISELPKPTVNFLKSAWENYDEYETIFDLSRSIEGYIDTYVRTFTESRSLAIAVMIDFFSTRWALHENRQHFIDDEKFKNKKEQLTDGISTEIENVFDNIKPSYKAAMLSKISGFNNRPLDWKLKRLRKKFKIKITENEISKYIEIRNQLAHTAKFPDKIDNTEAFLFMRHLLDRIILRIFGYEGKYFDAENRTEKTLA